MQNLARRNHRILTFAVAGIFTITSTTMMEKSSWADGKGKSKGEKHEKIESRENSGNRKASSQDRDGENGARDNESSYNRHGDDGSVRVYFGDQHRNALRNYYTEQYYRVGKCPPGLRKKDNGCVPPGKAKNWQVGRRLPREVIFHDLPPTVVVQLGSPPAGHRFVRVAADILLIAVGTGMVVDAIQDLNEM